MCGSGSNGRPAGVIHAGWTAHAFRAFETLGSETSPVARDRTCTDHSVITLTPLSRGMADTKRGRDKKARDADNRQRKRDIEESRERADETEPPDEDRDETRPTGDESSDGPRSCHRRGCTRTATFAVFERYQEETGHGAVEVEAFLCTEHAAEEAPTNLDEDYDEYVFRVEPLA